jgi:hypothetical protein
MAAGCAGDSPGGYSTPYAPGSAIYVGPPRDPTYPTGPCHVEVCPDVPDACDPNDAADIVVDASGKSVDVICYGQDVAVATVPVDQVPSFEAKNNTVLVIDSKADGPDVLGDLTISGNNAVVYGGGPDVSIIGGTVLVEKNNAKIRGVRIQGDVTIDKNNTKLLYCVIEGNLTISGNNTTVAACDVYGTVTIDGNNTVLVGDRFAGVNTVAGKNAECAGDLRFDDINADFEISDGELGGAVTCD